MSYANNECEVSHVCLPRFLHYVFEMTKQSFVIGEFCSERRGLHR